MAPSKDTLWPLGDHTIGKHLVLREYLKAWYPIMGRYNGRILFIDGFAGPGEYAGGEDGSPLVALKTLLEHRNMNHIDPEIVFVFIENDVARYEHLHNRIQTIRPSLPKRCRVELIHGQFNNELTGILDLIDDQNSRLAPSLTMIDPFGISDTPMSLVARLLSNSKCEVYVTFMYEFIDRFKSTPEFERHLDALYGCRDWRKAIHMPDSRERREVFFDLYQRQLRESGAKYVVRFDLFEGNRLVYAIFFGTGSDTGCNRMKEAIWKVDPFGDHAFHRPNSDQLLLSGASGDTEPFRLEILRKFAGAGVVPIEELERFAMSDETSFHKGQLKRQTLVGMEGRDFRVDEETRRRKHSYPDGCKLIFD